MNVTAGAALTVAEARAILRADEALDATFEARVAAGTVFDDEEREAWIHLVDAANDRLALFRGMSERSRLP